MVTSRHSADRILRLLLLTIIVGVTLPACDRSAPAHASVSDAPPAPPRPAEQVIAVIDLSGSVTDAEIARYRGLLEAVAAELSYGDRLVAVVAHRKGLKETTPTTHVEMPSARNPARPTAKEVKELKAARYLAAQSVDRIFASDRVPGTDLFASLHSAAEYAREGGARKTSLVLLSDMLQCVSGGLCIEEPGSVPAEGWTADRNRAGVLPDLAGICVSAVGGDPSTVHGVRVREFWREYFDATGASFDGARYRNIANEPSSLRCG